MMFLNTKSWSLVEAVMSSAEADDVNVPFSFFAI